VPGFRADPAVNILNLRAAVRWSSVEVTAFVSNALDAQPILGLAPDLLTAGTRTPRTVGLSGTWRLE